jgi:hypothetical protein
MANELGRLPDSDVGKPVTLDDPTKAIAAVVSKLDELIDAVVALDAANTGVPAVAALKKLVFRL